MTEKICEFELITMVGKKDAIPKDANAFYELFLKDSKGNLIDVPVLVSNFRDMDGEMPNTELNMQTSKLVHRFFITDTISGINSQGGYSGDKLPVVIRIAKSVKLRVQLDPEIPEHIKKPMLYITYEERAVNTITADSTTPVTYFVDYYEDITAVNQALLGIFIAANIIALIIIGVRIYYWVQHNPRSVLGNKYFSRLFPQILFFIFDEWATMMFWVSFFVNGYWFIMYKM